MEEWLWQLDPRSSSYADVKIPASGEGAGLTEAPRGALGHWVRVQDSLIANYQIITPTNWNASPRDDYGNRGPIEQAFIGTSVADPENPIEVVRVVRSFDPCLACAVHLISPQRDFGLFNVS
jgi:hydrogenase large subunit